MSLLPPDTVSPPVELLIDEVEGNVLSGGVQVAGALIRFMTNYRITDGVLLIWQLHVDGDGRNTLGLKVLRAVVTELGRQLSVREVIIEGGERVTGSAVGAAGIGPRKPRRLSFRVRQP